MKKTEQEKTKLIENIYRKRENKIFLKKKVRPLFALYTFMR